MAIKQLVESSQTVEVQRTTFSIEVVGRYVCNTLPEAVNNGGLPFDVVVLGAGMFGAYFSPRRMPTGSQLPSGDSQKGKGIKNQACQTTPAAGSI